MGKDIEKIEIKDGLGFHYEVYFDHHPHLGFTNALYNGSLIGQVELNKIHEPYSDDEKEWEQWEERYSEWKDEIKINLIPKCQEHFDKIRLISKGELRY